MKSIAPHRRLVGKALPGQQGVAVCSKVTVRGPTLQTNLAGFSRGRIRSIRAVTPALNCCRKPQGGTSVGCRQAVAVPGYALPRKSCPPTLQSCIPRRSLSTAGGECRHLHGIILLTQRSNRLRVRRPSLGQQCREFLEVMLMPRRRRDKQHPRWT